MWSQHLVPKPKDWSSHIDVVGFFLEPPNAESKSSQTTQFTPPRDLAQFLSEEESSPPIFVGFGSMVIDNPVELVEVCMHAYTCKAPLFFSNFILLPFIW
jgi:sterol 3beta-glucosyltransferase